MYQNLMPTVDRCSRFPISVFLTSPIKLSPSAFPTAEFFCGVGIQYYKRAKKEMKKAKDLSKNVAQIPSNDGGTNPLCCAGPSLEDIFGAHNHHRLHYEARARGIGSSQGIVRYFDIET